MPDYDSCIVEGTCHTYFLSRPMYFLSFMSPAILFGSRANHRCEKELSVAMPVLQIVDSSTYRTCVAPPRARERAHAQPRSFL